MRNQKDPAKSFRLFLVALMLLLGFGACDHVDYVFKETKTIDGDSWTYADPLSFSFSIGDTATLYQLLLDIEHKTAYPYQNLYTLIHTTYPDGQESTDTVPINFADHRGVWYGNCNATECDLAVTLQERVRFDQNGTYRVIFEQFTRMDSLPAIQSLTLKLVEFPG